MLDVDPDQRLARVQPGIVLDHLQAATKPHGLLFRSLHPQPLHTLELVDDPPCRSIAVLGFPDVASAADATPVMRRRPRMA